jgi:hypothetical protein
MKLAGVQTFTKEKPNLVSLKSDQQLASKKAEATAVSQPQKSEKKPETPLPAKQAAANPPKPRTTYPNMFSFKLNFDNSHIFS